MWRGVETMMPRALRDAMKAVRYSRDGLLTARGDVLADGVGVADAFRQAIGFTPARVAERYEADNHLRNRQADIEDARRRVLAAWRADLKAGGVSQATRDAAAELNAQHPYWAITGDTIRQSIRAANRYSQQVKDGLRLNPRLDPVLRESAAAPIW